MLLATQHGGTAKGGNSGRGGGGGGGGGGSGVGVGGGGGNLDLLKGRTAASGSGRGGRGGSRGSGGRGGRGGRSDGATLSGGGAPAGGPDGSSAAAPAGEDLLLGEGGGAEDDLLGGKRARKVRLTFKESTLISDKGLWRLYEQMQLLPLSRERGREAADMAMVIGAYRAWANTLFPKLHTDAVLEKCRDWSGRGLVKSVLSVMRSGIERVRAEGGGEGGSEGGGDGAPRPVGKELYNELTAQARAAAEAEADRRKAGVKKVRAEGLGASSDEGGGGEGGGAGEEADDGEEEEEVLDFTERRRAQLEAMGEADEGGGGSGGGGGASQRSMEDVGASQQEWDAAYAEDAANTRPAAGVLGGQALGGEEGGAGASYDDM